MAQWSVLNDESGLHGSDFAQTCVKNGFWDLKLGVKDGGGDTCNNRLRSLFNDVLSFFLREVCVHKEARPLPAVLGNGKPVDLFKLFWVVRKSGGYDAVSKNGLWGFLVEECGLSVGVVASVKLLYVKYLSEFDQWLWGLKRDNNLENGEVGVLEKLDLLVQELEGFRFSASSGKGNLKNESKIVNLESIGRRKENVGLNDRKSSELMEKEVKENGAQVDVAAGESELDLLSCKENNEMEKDAALRIRDDDENISVQDDDESFCVQDNDESFCVQDDVSIVSCAKNVVGNVLISQNDTRSVLSAKSVVEKVIGSHKRKRESSSSLLPMLNWLAHTARSSNDPAIGIIPESSKWKDYGSEELWKQALLARKALMIRRHVGSGIKESLLQNKLRMHPSMYEDNNILSRQSSERIRSSKRLPLLKSPACPCCNSCSSPCKTELENRPPKERGPAAVVSLTPKMPTDVFSDKPREKQVSVGPLFQAVVPAWTGMVFESDSKWLGTQMWPPQDDWKNVSRNAADPIGKGRESSCLCRLPGSTDCVRFHIAENRMKLSLELGPLFHRWKFNRMGEEVSLSWTIEEEKKFKLMVKSNSVSINKFWRNAFKFFPTKNREKLVSYYFNVLVIRQRSYQNRVTPNNIDSDDDETEFGSVGDSFGYERIHAPRIKCSQNMQCTDFD